MNGVARKLHSIGRCLQRKYKNNIELAKAALIWKLHNFDTLQQDSHQEGRCVKFGVDLGTEEGFLLIDRSLSICAFKFFKIFPETGECSGC